MSESLTKVAKTDKPASVIKKKEDVNLLRFNDMEQALSVCDQLAKSKFTPLEKKEDVLAALLLGEELGISKMIALNNVYSVNGKASVGFHVANGLLLRHGLFYEIIEDCVPDYIYYDVTTKEPYTREELDQISQYGGTEYVVVSFSGDEKQRQAQKENYLKSYEGKMVVMKHHQNNDVRSTVKMSRKIKQIDGSFENMTVTVTYRLSQVPERLRKSADQPWVAHLSQMLTHRTILIAARRIAGDVLNGMYEHTEMLDVHNIPYNFTDEGGIEIMGEDGNPIHTFGGKDDAIELDVEENPETA